jgi:hypothetical protein
VNWSLPAYVQSALDSPIPKDHQGALDHLIRLHRIGNDWVRDRVREEIRRLVDDDSKSVSAAASAWLEAGRTQRPPGPPAPERSDSEAVPQNRPTAPEVVQSPQQPAAVPPGPVWAGRLGPASAVGSGRPAAPEVVQSSQQPAAVPPGPPSPWLFGPASAARREEEPRARIRREERRARPRWTKQVFIGASLLMIAIGVFSMIVYFTEPNLELSAFIAGMVVSVFGVLCLVALRS